MALYKIEDKKIKAIERTTFAHQNIKERNDLQKMLKENIDIISPDTLVVAEEFGEWEDSRKRIDLLGLDKEANLIVIELKRTEDGGHMELQSIRYAAMISTLTFEKLVAIYGHYLKANNIEKDPSSALLEFLDWEEPDEDNFAQEVKIILASAEFSKELTTSVMWLNDFGLNIRCVRMHPYFSNGETFIDIQTVIPIPEVADYQIRIREKKQKERESREHSRDFTKFDVNVAGKIHKNQSKRWMMFRLVSEILNSGGKPELISSALPKRKFEIFEGTLNSDEVYEKIMEEGRGGKNPRSRRFFIEQGEFFHINGKTYVLSNQWGVGTLEAIDQLSNNFPEFEIQIKPSV